MGRTSLSRLAFLARQGLSHNQQTFLAIETCVRQVSALNVHNGASQAGRAIFSTQQGSHLEFGFLRRAYSKPPRPQDTPHDHEHVNIENEIEKELQRAGDRGGIKALLAVIDSHGEDFDEMNVTTAFHELAKVAKGKSKEELQEMHIHDTFRTLVDMVILGRRRFNARHLTSVIQSAAELHFDDEDLMDKISQNLLSRMDRVDAIEVTDLATGLATLGHSPSVVLFEALQKRAEEIKQDFSDEQIEALKKAFSKLGYEDYGKKI